MGVFRFKKFSVCDDNATMKVGTDAVLLGAWADVENVSSALDIGTGSGIIALMIAQRTNNISIDAIELLEADALQASENIVASPWSQRITITNLSLQKFHPQKKYDLIVCNPPYFTKSLLPLTGDRSSVRHDTQLTFEELLLSAIELLGDEGKLCLILPPTEAEIFTSMAETVNLFLNRRMTLFTREGKPKERCLLQFERELRFREEESVTLYGSGNQWSDDYWELTGDFYLNRQ